MTAPEGPTPAFRHEPVLLARVVELFGPVPPGTVVDATLGGGGHARALLAAHPHLDLVGIDQDPAALEAAGRALEEHGDRVALHRGRFDDLARIMAHHHRPVTGVLYDLGVSSPQLDRPERGFSYRADGPLDMRMDPSRPLSADEVVNGYAEDRLVAVLREHGDERYAGRIARAVVSARPIRGTAHLAEVVADAVPAPARRRAHPARRTFQAVRIEVNDELAILADSLSQALEVVAPLGRVAAISYHSGEDRIVKDTFLEAESGGCTCPVGLPCRCGAEPTVRLLKRGAWRPDADEVARNPRSESARLRAVERLAHSGAAGEAR